MLLLSFLFQFLILSRKLKNTYFGYTPTYFPPPNLQFSQYTGIQLFTALLCIFGTQTSDYPIPVTQMYNLFLIGCIYMRHVMHSALTTLQSSVLGKNCANWLLLSKHHKETVCQHYWTVALVTVNLVLR